MTAPVVATQLARDRDMAVAELRAARELFSKEYTGICERFAALEELALEMQEALTKAYLGCVELHAQEIGCPDCPTHEGYRIVPMEKDCPALQACVRVLARADEILK